MFTILFTDIELFVSITNKFLFSHIW